MKKIEQLSQSSSRLLHSSSIISSVFSVVKELVENSLDAEATSVEVKLENSGLDRIEVRDNGVGVSKNDVPFLAKPHYTSKITNTKDLDHLVSYGFRGEALGAICAVGEMSITTRTEKDQISTNYVFLKNGEISSSKPSACASGTSVVVVDLFRNIPVRKKFYKGEKHKREELKQIEDLLCSLAFAKIGTRFALYHNNNLLWQKSATSEMNAVLIQVFGNPVFMNLEHKTKEYEEENVKIDAYVPKKTVENSLTRSTCDRCFVLVNKRPVRVKSIEKLLQDIFCPDEAGGCRRRFPICLVDLSVLPSKVDINVCPNKSKIFFQNEEIILNLLSDALREEEKNLDVPSSTKPTSIHSGISVPKIPEATPEIVEFSKKTALLNGILTLGKTSLYSDVSQDAIIREPIPKLNENDHDERLIPGLQSCTLSLNESIHNKNQCASHTEGYLSDITDVKLCDQNFVSEQNNNLHHQSFSLSDTGTTAPTKTLSLSKTNSVQRKIEHFQSFSVLDKSDRVIEGVHKNVPNYENKGTEKEVTVLSCDVTVEKPTSACVEKVQKSIKDFHNISKLNQDVLSVETNNHHVVESNWSRGQVAELSENSIQPVEVLVPCTGKRKIPNAEDNGEICKKKFQTQLRPMTAFDFFCYEKRLEVISKSSGISNQEIARVLSEKWRSLSDREKSIYERKASEESKKNESKRKVPKETLTNSTENKALQRKVKRKNRNQLEKPVSFSFEKIQSSVISLKKWNKKHSDSGIFSPISEISRGIWVCHENNKLVLLNIYRIRETLIYHRLMDTFEIKADMIGKPIPITAEILRDEATFNTLLMLCMAEKNVNMMNKHIIYNGFNIKISRGGENMMAEIVGMSSVIPAYGISDLKEILRLIQEKGSSASLTECRPSKVSSYLQGEAVRISRQSLPMQMKQEINDFLRDASKFLPPYVDCCFHNKPFKHQIFNTSSLDQDKWEN